MGGLITLADQQDLPEGASPRCWDVDFNVGSALTRAGLLSVYTYDDSFAGPNLGDLAQTSGSGNAWTNPNGILGNSTYASVITDALSNSAKVPNTVLQITKSGEAIWSNANNITNPSTMASVTLGVLNPSEALNVSDTVGFSLPANATVAGILITFNAQSVGSPTQLTFQLTTNGAAVGTSLNIPLTSSFIARSAGSSAYQWGTILAPSNVNGTTLGVNIQAALTSGGSSVVNMNDYTITVYYTTNTESNQLNDTEFSFSLPSTVGLTGFGVLFTAYSTAATELSFQLLKNGVAVGTPHTQVLTTNPRSYTLGAADDLWGSTWLYTDPNNTAFGVQITASGAGTSFINNVQIEAFLTPGLANFNYVKTYEQNDEQIFTFALDASGILWEEDVTNNPGILNTALTGIIPGSFAKSATADDQEYIMFSNLVVGTDRPRVASETSNTSGLQFLPLSQVGPGAPPAISSSTSATSTLNISAYSLSGNIVTFTYTGTEPAAGTLLKIENVVSYLNGQLVSVLSTGLTATNFEVVFQHANDAGGSVSGTAVSPFSTPIVSITQPSANPLGIEWQAVVQSTGPGTSTTPGNVITVYYGPISTSAPDPMFAAMAQAGTPTYVQITQSQFANGVWLVTGNGYATPPGDSHNWWYFTFQAPTVAYLNIGANGAGGGAAGQYQVTQATMTVGSPLLGVVDGSTITITGATPSGWNNNWTIETSNSFVLSVVSTALANTGIATYDFSIESGEGSVQVGQLVTFTNTTNGNGVFNTTGTVLTTDGSTTLTMNIGVAQTIAVAPDTTGQGVVAGTNFTFDPGSSNLGPTGRAIFGNDSGTGVITVVGGVIQPVGAGTRQAVVFFITESGFETAPSSPITFTIGEDANYILVTQIPIGPPNVVGRGIAFTEAGQNGVPGANFYVIREPVVVVIDGQTITYTPTIINDNTTTSAQFTFTDAVLLNSEEIDVQGNDLFNLIELGSSAWCVPYAQRMFYGLQLNKIDNFVNMTFDGGYIANPGGNLQPLGWTLNNSVPSGGVSVPVTATSVTSNVVTVTAVNSFSSGQEVIFEGLGLATYLNDQVLTVLASGLSSTQFQVAFTHANYGTTAESEGTVTSINAGATLIVSQVTGMSLYIKDSIEGVTSELGFYSQTAYQDAYGVAIIEPNVQYSVRVAASNPSDISVGSLVIELVNFNQGTGFGEVYGSFSIPLSEMETTTQVFTGLLLPVPFGTIIPPGLRLAFFVSNMGYGSDVEIDRIEVFPTQEPYLLAQVYGSYVDDLEAIDASGTGGIVDTTSENSQPCMGGFVMHDTLYLLKTKSLYSTTDNPASEPGGWGLHEVSNRVGTIGISSYDVGEEWLVTACRSGIFGFNGGQPIKIMEEIYQIWEAINWFAGNTIVLRNDVTARKLFCAVPLPTPNKWLPNAPLNLAPSSPNVVLMLNYQGLNTFEEMISSPEIHTTMFGALAAVDMKRKWTIWQIPTPYMDFVTQQDGESTPLYICNGINSSKIYELSSTQYSDDGVAINSLYTTYGFVNAAKAVTAPIFGLHAKRYTWLQFNVEGSGALQVKAYPNTLAAKYPYTLPGVTVGNVTQSVLLSTNIQDDVGRPMNMRGNRLFLEFSTNNVGDWFDLHKILLSGKGDHWSPINPTGGGSVGVYGNQPS